MSLLSTRPASAARRLATGLAALVTVLGVTLGGPVALASWAPSPLPDHLPSGAEVIDALTAPDSGVLFLRVLAGVAWLAWLSFTLCVLVEIAGAASRRPSFRLPGLGGPQRLAAALVAAVLVASAPAVASGATPASAAPATATWLDTSRVLETSVDQTAVPEVYVVGSGDTLAGIAQRFLGDADRYPALGMSAGIDDYDVIQAGEQIWLPANSYDRGAQVHATGSVVTAAGIYTVQNGDALAAIADRFLGDPGRFGELARANGIADPNRINPGQRLVVPAGARDRGPQPRATGSFTPAKTSEPAPAPPSTPSPRATPRTPLPSDPTTASPRDPSPTASPSRIEASSTPSQPEAAATDRVSSLEYALPIGAPLAVAGLVAAGILAELSRRRRRQQQHRPVGRRIPTPPEPRPETELRAAAQRIAAERLDQAVRWLGRALTTRPPGAMPDIVGVWLDGEAVHLLLTKPCAGPPTPWIDDGSRWTLPADIELSAADELPAPFPALAAIGSQPGTHLLLDVERLGFVTLTGDMDRRQALLRYLAAELATNSWSDHVEVTLVGAAAGEIAALRSLSGNGRIDVADTVNAGVARMLRRIDEVATAGVPATDPVAERIADDVADGWAPHILLVANVEEADRTALAELSTQLAATGRCAAAVVVAADVAIGEWSVDIQDDGGVGIPFLGVEAAASDLVAAGLRRAELEAVAEVLETADLGTEPSASGDVDPVVWPAVPPAPEIESWAAGTDAAGGLHPPPSVDEPEFVLADASPDAGRSDPSIPLGRAGDVALDDAEHVSGDLGPLPSPRPTETRPVTSSMDPTLDRDFGAWTDADPTRLRIGIIGPVTLDAPGSPPRNRRLFHTEIAVYLAARGSRGATTDQLDDALWPDRIIGQGSRRVAVTRTRTWLGKTSGGEKWLPELTTDRRYRLRDDYLLDWHLFRRLRTRGESKGADGVSDLCTALALVRGAPLANADVAYGSNTRSPYPWLAASDIAPVHLVSAIVDTASRVVALCLNAGDLERARWAAEKAWLADVLRDSDVTWRDHIRIAAHAGNRAELEQLLESLMTAREAEVPEDLDTLTYRLLCDVMPDRLGIGHE